MHAHCNTGLCHVANHSTDSKLVSHIMQSLKHAKIHVSCVQSYKQVTFSIGLVHAVRLLHLVTLIRRAYIEKYIVDSDSSHKLPDSGILAYFSCSNFS